MKLEIKTLVIARPGYFRTGLVALLASMPQIAVVKTCDDVSLALNWRDSFVPQIVFFESYDPGAAEEVLSRLRQRWPAARQIVLAERPGEINARNVYGADLVLTREVQAGEFLRLIRRLAFADAAYHDHRQAI